MRFVADTQDFPKIADFLKNRLKLKKLAVAYFLVHLFIQQKESMSFLLQRQFFALQVQNRELKSKIEILNGIKDLFLDWSFSFSAKENMLEGITSEFSSRRYLNVQYFVQIGIDTNKNSFRFNLFILNNGIPVRIESKPHRIRLFRYFLQINRKLCLGRFSVCPKSGVLKFGGQLLAAEEILGQLNKPKCDQRLILLKLIQKVRRISQGIELYLIRIFRMVNYRASFHQNSDLSEVHIDRSYLAQIQELEKVLPYTHQELKYLTKSGWRLKNHESFTLVRNLLRISQIFQSKSMSSLENKIDSISPQQLHEWTELQCIHDQKTKNSEKVEKSQLLLDRFTIRRVRNLSITETCSVDLFVGSKCARPNDFQKPKIQVQFIKKSPLSQKGEKSISRQSKFVDLYMRENGKEGMAEYLQVRVFSKESYFDEQNLAKVQSLDEKSLFLSFYPNDVRKYTERRTNFMSLSSKLLLLLKIDKALSGMSKTKSQHMDLKPQNIMIDGSQNVRLIDFGQSVHPKLPLSSKPGVSIPYSAPEFFSRYKFSPDRCDTYSLGTMIFELVFNEVPQVLASKRQKIVPSYQSAESYRLMFRFQPQKLSYGAEQSIARLMGLLSMKCLNFSCELRPLEGWIRIYLKKLIQLSYHY